MKPKISKWSVPFMSAAIFICGLFLQNGIQRLFSAGKWQGNVHIGNQFVLIVALFAVVAGYIILPIAQALYRVKPVWFAGLAVATVFVPVGGMLLLSANNPTSGNAISDFLYSFYIWFSLVGWYFIPYFLLLKRVFRN